MTLATPSLKQLRPRGYVLCYSIAIAAIYALNGLVVIDASKHFDGLAAIWSANAILLCAIHGQRQHVAFAGYIAAFAASLFVNWHAGNSALVTLFFSIANIIEVALAIYLLKKFVGTDADHFDAVNLHRFVGIMVFATAVSASLSTAVLPDAPFKAWQSWFLSDLLGMLFVVPSLMILRQSIRPRQASDNARNLLAEFALISCLSAIVAGGVFMQNTMPVLFLISIPLLIAVFRCGRTGAVLSMLIVAGIAVISTLNGAGPIAGSNAAPFEQLLLLQLFLASQLLISLPVASVLEDRERIAAASVTREQQLRVLAQHAQWEAQRNNRKRAIAIARDDLTGLLSRSWIMARLCAQLTKAQKSRSIYTIAIFDIDHFKRINDKYGHLGGDEVLAAVGRSARNSMPRRFSIGRIGGEEFLMLMPDTDIATASVHVEHLRQMIAMGTAKNTDVTATISVGIACADRWSTTKTMLANADGAMYRAKTSGRDQVKIAA